MATIVHPSAAELLEAMIPPLKDLPRRDYRRTVTGWAAAMSFEDLRTLCSFFQCSVERIVTRIMDYQYDRARHRAVAERIARRHARKAGTP